MLFVQQFVEADNQENIKASLCKEKLLVGLTDSPHKGPVMQETFPCHIIIILWMICEGVS